MDTIAYFYETKKKNTKEKPVYKQCLGIPYYTYVLEHLLLTTKTDITEPIRYNYNHILFFFFFFLIFFLYFHFLLLFFTVFLILSV